MHQQVIWKTNIKCVSLYLEVGGRTMTPKFSIGDNVRITNKKKTFDKGCTQR